MRVFIAAALLVAGCRTTPEPSAQAGYVGIDQVEILAKGME
jgi:hypothetical protein